MKGLHDFVNYLLNNDPLMVLFTDVNECQTGEAKCDANAICINFEGGFSCKCKEGYQGTGFVCTGGYL